MKYIILSITFLFFCVSCEERYRKFVFNNSEAVKVSILQDSSEIGLPLEMIKYNDYLFISDFRGDSLLWIYHVCNNKMVKKYAPVGEGPNEFLSPIQFILIDSTFIIHNRWHFNSGKYIFNKADLTFSQIEEKISLSTDIDMIFPLNNNSYVASGRFKNSRFVILNNQGKITSTFGDYPDYNSEEVNIPNFPKFMFHQTQFTGNYKENLLACVSSHVIEVYDLSSITPKRVFRTLLSPYKYKYSEGDEWATAAAIKNTEKGVRRIYSTNKYIYLLYDPNIESQEREGYNIMENEIWIFDWTGKAVLKVFPDLNITSFCVDELDNVIYCIVNNPEPTISKINIKNLI